MNIYFIFSHQELEKYFSLDMKSEHKLFVFDHYSKIICLKKSIKFEAIIDKNCENVLSMEDHKKLQTLLSIFDNQIKFKYKINYDFFSNYHQFITIIRFYQFIIFTIEKIISINSKNCFFNFFLDFRKRDITSHIVRDFEKKYPEIIINKIYISHNINFYQSFYKDDSEVNFFKKNLKKILSKKILNNNIKILSYLTEKEILISIKKTNKFNIVDFENYTSTYQNKKFRNLDFTKNINIKEYIKISSDFNSSLNYLLNNIFKLNYLFLNKSILNLEKIFTKKKFNIFITSHPTLLSNIIKEYFLKKSLPTLTFLHGANLGHFENILPFPSYVGVHLKKYDKSYFNVFTKDFLEDFLKKNKYFHFIKKKHLTISQSIKIKNASDLFNNSLNLSKNNIGYFSRKEINLHLGSNINSHDFKEIYNLRKNLILFLSEIGNVNLSISSYYNDIEYFTCKKNINNKIKKFKSLNFYYLNAKSVINLSKILIFEQFSTTIVEAMTTDKFIIFYDNNLNRFYNDHLLLLKKRIIFVKSDNELFKKIDEIFNNRISNNLNFNRDFVNKFYINNNYLDIENILKSIICR